MDNNTLNFTNTQDESVVVKNFLTKVFTWMLAALVISGAAAWLFATNIELQNLIIKQVEYTVDGQLLHKIGFTTLGWVAVIAPLGFILIMNFGMQRLSLPVLLCLFVLFSLAMGMTLSTLAFTYASVTIVKTLFISAGAFGFMAFLGATTKTDLTKLGSYLYMGLFGMIIASIFSAFTGGGHLIIDILGVIIFTGLTSYQVQMLKNMALSTPEGGEQTQKVALMGALSLYMTFINLFMILLNLSGDRK
jgi:FtsH-binding integral membrane protein